MKIKFLKREDSSKSKYIPQIERVLAGLNSERIVCVINSESNDELVSFRQALLYYAGKRNIPISIKKRYPELFITLDI